VAQASTMTEARKRILLLEDSEDLRILLTRHLVNAGYEVLPAEDAVEAAQLMMKRRPDLIVADIHLPYMDGDEFVAAVVEHARRLGAVAYFDKSVSSERLLEVIDFYARG
jgi:response regulator RpfG family c-di-GMP phosphodiesterase